MVYKLYRYCFCYYILELFRSFENKWINNNKKKNTEWKRTLTVYLKIWISTCNAILKIFLYRFRTLFFYPFQTLYKSALISKFFFLWRMVQCIVLNTILRLYFLLQSLFFLRYFFLQQGFTKYNYKLYKVHDKKHILRSPYFINYYCN